jgi:DNA-binding CsgD family transcriptional regulator
MTRSPARRRNIQDVSADGWSGLFSSAFASSRNGMLLADQRRQIVDANAAYLRLVAGRRGDVIGSHLWEQVFDGPLATPQEWADALAQRRFTGVARLRRGDAEAVPVQWGAHAEVVTGRRLILFVMLGTARWGARFRRAADDDAAVGDLTAREREVTRLVALGLSGPEIAEELHVSHQTVRTHVRNATRKLGARSRAHLVAKAMAGGLLGPLGA